MADTSGSMAAGKAEEPENACHRRFRRLKLPGAMEVKMPRFTAAAVLVPTLFGLSACVSEPPPRETQVIVQPVPQQLATVTAAPGPPPLPHSELVPPPPQGAGPVVWQPGHWLYTDNPANPWAWQPGQYVPPPPGQTTWIPGHWLQQPSGAWTWIDGHWA
jgi:hypothetical protein